MKIVDMKIELQSKGVRIDWKLEKKIRKKHPTSTSDYLSFLIGDIPVAVLNGFYTNNSPFEIVENSKGFCITKNGKFYTDLKFLPRPKFFDKTTSDGVKMERMCKLVAPGFLIIYLHTGCLYWGEMQCKFCVTGYLDTVKVKKPEQVAETLEMASKFKDIKTHVALTSGALPKDNGSKLLADTAKAIKARVNVPISVNGEPPRDLSWIDKMSDADSVYINLEVFDEKTRKKIMPGKSEFKVGYYDKVFKRCLDVFDENQVASVLLAGLEDDKTYLTGVEHLANLGVVPVPVPSYPTTLSKLNKRIPPSAERMKNIYMKTIEIIKEHGLDPFAVKAGFMRGGALFALKEVMLDV